MLCSTQSPKNDDLFQIPYGPVLNWEEIKNVYPKISIEMDGKLEENCLLFYYELNPVTNIYKARDDDSESDLAVIYEIDLYIVSKGEDKDNETARHEDENRLDSLKEFAESCSEFTKDELKMLKESGISKEEYKRLMNEDSFSSTASYEEQQEENGKRKMKKAKVKNAKKERRKLLLESRNKSKNESELKDVI